MKRLLLVSLLFLSACAPTVPIPTQSDPVTGVAPVEFVYSEDTLTLIGRPYLYSAGAAITHDGDLQLDLPSCPEPVCVAANDDVTLLIIVDEGAVAGERLEVGVLSGAPISGTLTAYTSEDSSQSEYAELRFR